MFKGTSRVKRQNNAKIVMENREIDESTTIQNHVQFEILPAEVII